MQEGEYLERLRELWKAAWPRGVPQTPHYPHGERPLTDYLRHWADQQPNKPAVVFYGHTLTYRALDDLSDRFAALLARHGVRKGDRVAVFLPNSPQFHIVFFGILKLGAVHVPVSPLSRAFELTYELEDTGAQTIVTLDTLMSVVREVRAQTSLRTVFVTRFADVLPQEPTIPVPESLRSAPVPCDDAIDLLPALAAMVDGVAPPSADLDAIAALNYTGGTTGMPKGCVHTQRDMIYTAASNYGIGLEINANSVFLSFFPEFWIAGENVGLIFPVFAGATLVLLARWDPLGVMTAIQRYRVTITVMPVDGAVELMDHSHFTEFDLGSLRQVRVVSFVKKLNKDYRARWKALTGSTLAESAWGMTETHTSDTFTTGFQDGDFDLGVAARVRWTARPWHGVQNLRLRHGCPHSARRRRRDPGAQPVFAESLLEQAGGNGGRRSGTAGSRPATSASSTRRGFLHFLGRAQGNAKGQGHERIPAGDRSTARPTSGGTRLRRRRTRGPRARPGTCCLHPAQAGRARCRARRHRRMVPRADGELQGARRSGS